MLLWLECALLAALVIPLLRLVGVGSFRSRVGAPAVALLILLAIAYLITIIALALFVPLLLHLLFFVALILCAYLVYRAQPNYGRRNKLPPGSLTLFPIAPWTNQDFYKNNFQKHGTIFKTSDLHRPQVCILGIQNARDFLSENHSALCVPPFGFARFTPQGILRFTDPATHAKYRPILQSALTSSVYESNRTSACALVEQTLRQMAVASTLSPTGIAPKPALREMLYNILTQLFFGITPDSPNAPQFRAQFSSIARIRPLPFLDSASHRALASVTAALREHAHDGTIPSYAAELEHIHPGALSDPFLLNNLIFTMRLAWNDLTGLFFWLTHMLTLHPEWLPRVSTSPGSQLSTHIVFETLRLAQSEFLIRRATQNLHFQGYFIPKGWHIRVCIRESHLLSSAFENPTVFDPGRFAQKRYSRSQYMPFGAPHKSCLGEQLTVQLASDFVTTLARACDLTLVSDGPAEFNGFHWEPSPKFRLRLLSPPPLFTLKRKLTPP